MFEKRRPPTGKTGQKYLEIECLHSYVDFSFAARGERVGKIFSVFPVYLVIPGT